MKVYSSVKEFREYIDKDLDGGWGEEIPVYMTSGGFDPLHVGHLRCIQETVEMAEKDGGYVAIIVNGDGFLERKKGKAFMPAAERAEIVAGIHGVDAAIIWDDGGQTVIGAIDILKPTYFTKGGDRASPEDIPEWEICNEVGCRVIFNVGGGKVQSSSWLIDGTSDAKN
jgi:D-beta-D-heptose 7-phosphate kinase/D-beta-D-heptose 1-phosphate adenosyltransferase